jgi:hypothetical protein
MPVLSKLKSNIRYRVRNTPQVDHATVAQTFRTTIVPHVHQQDNHQHSAEAANRAKAMSYFVTAAANCGYKPYVYQMAKRDIEAGYEGRMIPTTSKELTLRPRNDKIRPHHAIIMIDCDYKDDKLEKFLAKHNNPVLIYTSLPDTAGGTNDATSHTFNEKGELVELVSQTLFKHKIWNWTIDTLHAQKTFWKIRNKSTTYKVELRKIAYNRVIVCLFPMQHYGLVGTQLSKNIITDRLERLNPVNDKVITMQVTDKNDELKYSISRVNTFTSVDVTVTEYEALCAVSRRNDMTPFTVQSYIPDLEKTKAAILSELINPKFEMERIPRVIKPIYGVQNYRFTRVYQYEDAKPSLVSFMSPFSERCFAPTQSLANTALAAKERVTDLQNNVFSMKAATITPFQRQLVNDFLEMLEWTYDKQGEKIENVKNKLHPVELEDVEKQQKRPTQRRIIRTAVVLGDIKLKKVRNFLKKEAYSEVKPPRMITTYNPKQKVEWSQYMQSLAMHLKKLPWYAFGKTPKDVAGRVADICSESKLMAGTDFSRMDGHISEKVRKEFELRLMQHLFHPVHSEEIAKLHSRNYNTKASTFPQHISYEAGFSRGSGSPETSNFNSLLSAFIAFCTLMTQVNEDGTKHTKESAWKKLGLFGGDDGLQGDISGTNFAKVSSEWGQKAKITVWKKGEVGVQFLARDYGPQVWYGDPDSCCDLPRQLRKIHTMVNKGMDPKEMLVLKSLAYYLTDGNTPIIGDFVTKVSEIVGKKFADNIVDHREVASWWAQYPKEVQFPNSNLTGWMDAWMVLNLGWSRKKFKELLAKCNTLEDLMEMPLMEEISELAPHATEFYSINKSLPLIPPVKEIQTAESSSINKNDKTICNSYTELFNKYYPDFDKSTNEIKDKGKTKVEEPGELLFDLEKQLAEQSNFLDEEITKQIQNFNTVSEQYRHIRSDIEKQLDTALRRHNAKARKAKKKVSSRTSNSSSLQEKKDKKVNSDKNRQKPRNKGSQEWKRVKQEGTTSKVADTTNKVNQHQSSTRDNNTISVEQPQVGLRTDNCTTTRSDTINNSTLPSSSQSTSSVPQPQVEQTSGSNWDFGDRDYDIQD